MRQEAVREAPRSIRGFESDTWETDRRERDIRLG